MKNTKLIGSGSLIIGYDFTNGKDNYNELVEQIGDLCTNEHCEVSLSFHTSGELFISVVDRISSQADFLIANWTWTEDFIVECIKNTIHRVKELDKNLLTEAEDIEARR